jgi:hypothetical protein
MGAVGALRLDCGARLRQPHRPPPVGLRPEVAGVPLLTERHAQAESAAKAFAAAVRQCAAAVAALDAATDAERRAAADAQARQVAAQLVPTLANS